MAYDNLRQLRNAFIKHGKTTDKLPNNNDQLNLTPLGSGGVMLSRLATDLLVSLFRGDDDLVVVDRVWLERQMILRGVEPGDAELLSANLPASRNLNLCVTVGSIASAT